MTEKLSHIEEAFCQAFVSEKLTQSDAYRKAHPICLRWKDKTIHEKASVMMSKDKVKQRIADLKASLEAKLIEELAYTRKDHFEELKEERKFAKKCENPAVSCKATELKGKLCGFYEDVTKIKGDKNNPIETNINIKWE